MSDNEIIIEYDNFDIKNLTVVDNKYIFYKNQNLVLITGVFSCIDKNFIDIQPILPVLTEISQKIKSIIPHFDDNLLIGKRRFFFSERPSTVKNIYYCRLKYKFKTISQCCNELNYDLTVIPHSRIFWTKIRELLLIDYCPKELLYIIIKMHIGLTVCC